MITCRIVPTGRRALVFVPFTANELVRLTRGHRWDKAGRCWTVPIASVPDVAALLQRGGHRIQVDQARRAEQREETVA